MTNSCPTIAGPGGSSLATVRRHSAVMTADDTVMRIQDLFVPKPTPWLCGVRFIPRPPARRVRACLRTSAPVVTQLVTRATGSEQAQCGTSAAEWRRLRHAAAGLSQARAALSRAQRLFGGPGPLHCATCCDERLDGIWEVETLNGHPKLDSKSSTLHGNCIVARPLKERVNLLKCM